MGGKEKKRLPGYSISWRRRTVGDYTKQLESTWADVQYNVSPRRQGKTQGNEKPVQYRCLIPTLVDL